MRTKNTLYERHRESGSLVGVGERDYLTGADEGDRLDKAGEEDCLAGAGEKDRLDKAGEGDYLVGVGENTVIYSNFPWPPPDSSAFSKIPSSILSNHNAKISLMNVAHKLEAALDQTGYSQKKYYQIPDGFALVSQLEQFNPDGTSKDLPDRWAAEFRPPKIFSLKSYIKAIFTANPGQYRIVVFIVTSRLFEESEETVTRQEAMAWLDKGMMVLPKSIGEQPYTDKYYCTALIYEFELPGNGKEAVFRTSSNLTGRDHLKKSKLWAALER